MLGGSNESVCDVCCLDEPWSQVACASEDRQALVHLWLGGRVWGRFEDGK